MRQHPISLLVLVICAATTSACFQNIHDEPVPGAVTKWQKSAQVDRQLEPANDVATCGPEAVRVTREIGLDRITRCRVVRYESAYGFVAFVKLRREPDPNCAVGCHPSSVTMLSTPHDMRPVDHRNLDPGGAAYNALYEAVEPDDIGLPNNDRLGSRLRSFGEFLFRDDQGNRCLRSLQPLLVSEDGHFRWEYIIPETHCWLRREKLVERTPATGPGERHHRRVVYPAATQAEIVVEGKVVVAVGPPDESGSIAPVLVDRLDVSGLDVKVVEVDD